MAEGHKPHEGGQPGRHASQPLELNWAGCDLYGSDLFNLDEADSELLNLAANSDEAERDLFLDINISTQPPREGRRVSWARVLEEGHPPAPPRNVPWNASSSSSTYKSPEYPPTLLELEVQALAQVGFVKLYHDSRNSERDEARAEGERKLAIINRFDLDQQALSLLPSQRPQQAQAPERGDLPELGKVATARMKRSENPTAIPPQTSDGGTDLLELQKVALSSMKGGDKSSTVVSGSARSPPPLPGNNDFFELQKVSLSSMRTANQALAPDTGLPSTSGTDFLELQKVALASIKQLSEKVLSRSTTPVSGPVPQPSSTGRDLLELQRTALANMQNYQTPHPASSTLLTTAPTSPPQQEAGGSDLLELQKVALRSIKNEPSPAPLHAGGELSSQKDKVKTTRKPTPVTQQAGGGELLELQKVALKSIPNQLATAQPTSVGAQQAGGGDSSEMQKVAQKSFPNLSGPAPPSAAVTQLAGDGDLLELQKIAPRSVQVQISPDRGPNFLEERKTTPTSIPSPAAPAQIRQDGGGDLLELQKVALANMSAAKGVGGRVVPEDEKLKRQYNTQGGGGTSPPSPSTMFSKMPAREPLEIFLQEISTKDQALQSASRTIQEKDQLLQEYEGSLANALNLLQSMYVRCTDAQVVTARVLTEGEDICGNLRAVCRFVENYDCSSPICAKGIHFLGGSSTAAPDDMNFHFGREDRLGRDRMQLVEPRNLVEEVLMELRNVELARKEAQEGVELQIQRNERLIAELQLLDVTPPLSERATCGNIERGPQELVRQHADNVVHTGHSEHTSEPSHLASRDPSDKVKGNQSEHVYENPRDQAKVCGYAYENLSNQANENPFDHRYEVQPSDKPSEKPCDHRYENTSGQAKGNLCDHEYENSDDQTVENLCDHRFENLQNDQASERPCDHAYESPSDDKSNEQPCDHTYESPSDDKPNEKPCDHVYESSSDGKVNAKLCDHAYESHPSDQANESPCDRVYESPHALADGTSCDHAYDKPGDQSRENNCDHDFEKLDDHASGNQCDHVYESPGGQFKGNRCDHDDVTQEDQSTERQCNHTFESLPDQTSEKPCDHDFRGSCVQTSSEIPYDRAYEDGKECGPIHEWEDIGSSVFNSSTWMGPGSDKQLTKSVNEVQVKTPGELSGHEGKQHKYAARISGPNALWEHLQHFVGKQQPQPSDAEKTQSTTQLMIFQGGLDLRSMELQSQLEQRTSEVDKLHTQISQLKTSLLQEQDDRKKILLQYWPTKSDLECKDKVIRKLHFQMHQLEAALQVEREEMRESLIQKTNGFSQALAQKTDEMNRASAAFVEVELRDKEINELRQQLQQMQREHEGKESSRKALTLSVKMEMDNLQASLHAKDENVRELHEAIARKESTWQTERHQMMKNFDDLETRLLVKEEEVIKLTQELELSRSSVYSLPPDEVKFKSEPEGSHFFQKQGKDEGREILDLRCEVLSLQDCLGIKTQAIKTMEKELTRSYNIVSELRSKLRAMQECERTSQKQGQYSELMERLRSTEEKLQQALGEKGVTSNRIQDMSARCKYLEECERMHREGSGDMKDQGIKDLEQELERNVEIIKTMQVRCSEYEAQAKQAEARNMIESAGRSSDSGTYDSRDHDNSKMAQLRDEREAFAAECDKLRSQIKRKDQVIIQLQGDMHYLKTKASPKCQQNALAVFADNGRSRLAMPVLDHTNVDSSEVNTLRERLREQWKLQKVMEERLNTMMAYVSDRVDEFERTSSPSDATSDSSFPPNTELNHFHVEAKLMKLQLEQQLQVLRGTAFISLPASGVTSPGECPQNCLVTQDMQLLSEKNALEDSAQTLQEKTSRLLNRLTYMRSEFGPNSR